MLRFKHKVVIGQSHHLHIQAIVFPGVVDNSSTNTTPKKKKKGYLPWNIMVFIFEGSMFWYFFPQKMKWYHMIC